MKENTVLGFFAKFSGGRTAGKKPIVVLTKMSHVEHPVRKSTPIEIGFSIKGTLPRPLAVGQSLYIEHSKGMWHTSVVLELLSDGMFRTMNSIYKLEFESNHK